MSDGDFIRRGPARVFVGGEELNGGIDSMRWDGEKLIAEVDVEVLGSVEWPQVASIEVPARTVREGTLKGTITWPRPSLRTRLWCALWHGHWPARQNPFDFACDYWRCRCGKVVMPTEELLIVSERYGRRPPW